MKKYFVYDTPEGIWAFRPWVAIVVLVLGFVIAGIVDSGI